MTAGKLFGDFLVEKGLLTPETLLQVLVDQMRNVPSIAEAVYDGRFLPLDVQLEILRLQTRHKWSYQEASAHLGYWTDDLVSKISEATEKSRTPLGQLVLSKTNMKFTELTKALDEYLSQDLSSKSADTKPPLPHHKIGSIPAGSTQAAELSLNTGKPTIGENLLSELLEVFSDERRTRIDSLMQTLNNVISSKQVDSDISGCLRTIHSEFQALWGAARFVRLDLIGALIHSLESAVVKCIKADRGTMTLRAGQFIMPCRVALDEVWRLRTYLRENRSELHYLDVNENQESYTTALSEIDKLSTDFDTISGVA